MSTDSSTHLPFSVALAQSYPASAEAGQLTAHHLTMAAGLAVAEELPTSRAELEEQGKGLASRSSLNLWSWGSNRL
ncbi:hypothetical protein HMN09_00301300 [Mycena chlorophos]|uniref:Uncharacterized protein n=1 Tax=Mycena chlorophos TaxID=658473 RepID=A0A8H6TM52_MYCCL|nr:hypothetical protein HMN09_00301300 [Mycena chlorophos]